MVYRVDIFSVRPQQRVLHPTLDLGALRSSMFSSISIANGSRPAIIWRCLGRARGTSNVTMGGRTLSNAGKWVPPSAIFSDQRFLNFGDIVYKALEHEGFRERSTAAAAEGVCFQ